MTSLKKLVVAYDCSNLMSEEEFKQSEASQDYSDHEVYLDCEQQFMWEDFCDEVGVRLINMLGVFGGKVKVKGYNLNWRGSNGEKTIEVDTSETSSYKVGRNFMFQLVNSIDRAYLLHVGKYDTNKSFDLIVPTHDCVMTFEIRKKR